MDLDDENRADIEVAVREKRKRKIDPVNIELQSLFDVSDIQVDGIQKSKAACKIEGCTKVFIGKHLYYQNMYRHVHVEHSDLYESIKQKFRKLDDEKSENKKKKVSVLIDEDDINRACVLLVTKDGRPFSALNDKGFRMILNPILEGLQKQGTKVTINAKNIKAQIDANVIKLKERIKKETEGRILSLMIDTVTKHLASTLGINLQYICEDQVIVRTIGMARCLESKTGEYLANVIKQYLREYNIDLAQIYTLTTDNGGNMLTTSRWMDQSSKLENKDIVSFIRHLISNTATPNVANEDSIEEEDEDGEESSVEENEEETSDDENSEEESHLDQQITAQNSLSLEELEEIYLRDNQDIRILIGINCAAHTLQLVVKGAINNCEITTEILKKVRKIVCKLRTQNYSNIMKRRKLKQAILDSDTRWNYTYLMVGFIIYHSTCRPICVSDSIILPIIYID